MRVQTFGALASFAMIAMLNAQATQPSSPTVAYWRFESATAGRPVSPDRIIEDVSGNGNHLRTFEPGTAPSFVETSHWEFVPQTRRANRIAIDNSARPERPFPTRDLFVAPENSTFDLVKGELSTWTIEASVNFKPIENWERRWQTFIGREGYNVPKRDALHEDPLSNLGFKKRGDNNHISIEAFDSTGTYVVVQSKEPVKPDEWYDLAAVSDGRSLKLYMKSTGDDAIVLQDTQPFTGELMNGGEGWTVGRGCFAFNPAEQMFGLIDEVRISAAALSPDRFLASPAAKDVRADSEFDGIESTTVPTNRPSVAAQPTPPTLIHPHDPVLVRAGDMFHLLASHGGLFHWRSKDLVHWENVPSVMKVAPQWAIETIAPEPGIWAPDVGFFNGKFHLYYSLSRFGSQRSAIALMTGASLDPDDSQYGWTDEGSVVESQPRMDFNAIDPAIAFDADSQPWLAWGSFNKGIYLAKIDPNTGKLVGDPTQIAARPGNTALEAPHIFYREGNFYLVVSYDFCCRGSRSTYKLVVGRARQITGPYLSRDGKPMLDGEATLLLRSHDFCIGPGQSSTVEVNGKWMLAHHYYDARRNGEPTLAVRDLYFDAEGWPILGEPYAELGGPSEQSLAGKYRIQLDYSDAGEIELADSGSMSGILGPGRWSMTGAILSLHLDGSGSPAITTCFVAQDRNTFITRRSDGSIIRAVRLVP